MDQMRPCSFTAHKLRQRRKATKPNIKRSFCDALCRSVTLTETNPDPGNAIFPNIPFAFHPRFPYGGFRERVQSKSSHVSAHRFSGTRRASFISEGLKCVVRCEDEGHFFSALNYLRRNIISLIPFPSYHEAYFE